MIQCIHVLSQSIFVATNYHGTIGPRYTQCYKTGLCISELNISVVLHRLLFFFLLKNLNRNFRHFHILCNDFHVYPNTYSLDILFIYTGCSSFWGW
jgi:hypothetical protein